MLIALVGQTASGKSDLALDLGQYFGGAIISADAMQLYRGLDIGTAKTKPERRRSLPHYQLDELSPSEEASVATYQEKARRDIRTVEVQGLQPIVAGGSALYLRALLDRLEFPGGDVRVREELEQDGKEKGSGFLYERLKAADPLAAMRIHPNNVRRIIRALEVITVTGRPFSATLPKQEYFNPDTIQIAIRWPIEELDERINTRTQAMFDAGLVEEVEGLLASDKKLSKTAALATGYAQAIAVVNGEMTMSDARDQVALATRQLARRQAKWFKRDPRINWLDPGRPLFDQALNVIETFQKTNDEH